ncbi:response regulator transcription factor [Paenibacillus cymbidii]|uniref:response regulator transcription factor n=1 Tax=Paenibacillus cymbidii TaxID=1639034 RepID=UPI0010818AC3|nr:helix-turn-helix domain-containing protein [Paenibacillus cymbidii]
MTITVLVINNTAIDRHLIVHTFDWRKLNCRVIGQAENGSQGKTMIQQLQPDIVIADIRKTDKDSLELADWMNDNYPTAKTILTSWKGDFEPGKHPFLQKVHAVVAKPLQREELYKAVESAVRDLDNIRRTVPSLLHQRHAESTSGGIALHETAEDDGHDYESVNIGSILQELEQFDSTLERASTAEIDAYTNRLLAKIKAYSNGNPSVIKGLVSQLCMNAVLYFYRITRNECGLDKSVDQLLDEALQLEDIQEASFFLSALFIEVKDKLGNAGKEYIPFVKQVQEHINSHYNRDISLASTANKFGYSPSHLSRTIRKATGVTFTDLVARARIEAAKRLLKDGKYNVNQVGDMVGFKEYAYFYHVFKRMEGVSPKEYKNNGKAT